MIIDHSAKSGIAATLLGFLIGKQVRYGCSREYALCGAGISILRHALHHIPFP